MRISYIVNQYPKVSHSFIRREILALERLGHEVQRISIRGWGDVLVDNLDKKESKSTLFILRDGVIQLLLDTIKTCITKPSQSFQALCVLWQLSRKSDRSLLLHLVTFFEACRIQPWLKAHESTFIHAHFGTNSAEIAMYASILSAVPFSFTVHGPEEFDKPISLGLGLKASFAAFVVAISSYGRSQLMRWLDYKDWTKLKVVHCGLDSDFYTLTESRQSPPIPQFVCIGRLCEQKGQLLLIEAVAKLKNDGRQFKLILAGDGEMRDEIESRIDALGVRQYVEITGWIDSSQVKQLLLCSSAMVLPSFAEGLPVVIMEAMSLECPVISTYVAGIPELVRDGINGWLVAAGDAEVLAEAMRVAIDTDAADLLQMGKQARVDALARHAIDCEAEKLSRLFEAHRQ